MENACATSLTEAARLVQLLKIDGYSTTNTVDSSSSYNIKTRWNVDGSERNSQTIQTEDLVRKIQDDALTLECTITVLKELPVQTFPVKEIPMPAVPSSNLHTHFGELLQSGAGADVTFLVSGESIAAHKLVLAARSLVFMAQFYGQMMEKSSQLVEVKDMEATVFKALLRFIYTDTAPDFDQQQKEAATVMAQHLLAAADRYGLDRLKLICVGRLSGGINVDTVAATLALAEQHGCEQLKDRCIEFIVKTPEVLDAVLATEGYKHLEASCPSVLTDLLVCKRKKLKRR